MVQIVPLTEATWPALERLFGPNGAVAGCWCTWFWQTNKQLYANGSDGNRALLLARVRAGDPVGLLAIDDVAAGDGAVGVVSNAAAAATGSATALGWVAVAPLSSYPRLARSSGPSSAQPTRTGRPHPSSSDCTRTVGQWGVAGPDPDPGPDRSGSVEHRGAAGDAEVWSVTCFFVHRTARRTGLAATLLAGAVEHARAAGARAIEGYPVDTDVPRSSRVGSGELYHGTLRLFTDAGFQLVERRGVRRALVRRNLR